MSITLAAFDVLAQQTGDKIPVAPVQPPGSDKIQLLLGVGLWLATAAIVGYGILSGVKFAAAYSEGHASSGQKMAPVACAIGAAITGSAAAWVSFFL
ncbi:MULTISPECIES: hypothetical protein [Nocardia]|uniref:hypothetical protein n=1 Tax=Nocardia TaxID=1817 RepID=UPI002453A5D4|nr:MULTISPECIES: hypothetical protein [Nocardia]